MTTIFKVNRQGVNQLLRGPQAAAVCKEACIRTAETAGADLEDPEGMLVVEAGDANRARSIVVTATTEAMLAESRDRALTRAFANLRI